MQTKAFFKTAIAVLLSLGQIFSPIFAVIFKGGEKNFFEKWSPSQAYTDDYAVNIEKDPQKDFVILNITDVQFERNEAYAEFAQIATKTIDRLVEEVKPDLITLTGDNGYCTSAYLKIIKDVDKYGIPWAPVMGNHDGTCCISEFWCAYRLYKAENCLFKFGPENMGYGNYIINIKENGKIIHTLFMMDTHSDLRDEANINGAKDSGYDNLWENQIEWYKWAVNGITTLEGHTVESTVFFHIPLVEFRTAWDEAYDKESGKYVGEYAETSFGENHEPTCCAPLNNGFFTLCKELGSTKNIVCGHDHTNYSSILYDGIRLTYALKCGPGGYWEENVNGGTMFTINSTGSIATEHVFVDPNTL